MPLQFRNTVFQGTAANLVQCMPPDLPEIILTGRSNVGKSTLVNVLAGNRHLARISGKPGKTRMIVYFLVDRKLLLTDMPGYGHAGISKSGKAAYASLVDQYLNSSRNIILMLHLLDIRHPPSNLDRQMLAWIQHQNIPCRIVLTKADKISRNQAVQAINDFASDLGVGDPGMFILFSQKTGQGADIMRDTIRSFYTRRISF